MAGAHIYQPEHNGRPTRSFATKAAAVRWCQRTIKREGGTVELKLFTSPSGPGTVIATFGVKTTPVRPFSIRELASHYQPALGLIAAALTEARSHPI